MTKKLFSFIVLFFTGFSAHILAEQSELNDESIEIAELIVKLAPDIALDLARPATGADRIVTHATKTWEGNRYIYLIEGQDVLHDGRVLSNYQIRLEKYVSLTNSNHSITSPLPAESFWLIGALLNGLYDIAEMNLEHRAVELDYATEIISENEDEVLTYELVGINKVCDHDELNTFKIIVTRYWQHRRPYYVVNFIKPYNDVPNVTLPVWPIPDPVLTPIPVPVHH
ncbi:MAG: hypothetical protein H6731_03445 [Myxococcales bacterium]|nr:MAG: hypothetical protein H6731_03445 [Myxococcales bacterium]